MALPLNSSVSHVANLSPVLEGNDPDNSVHPSKKFAIRSTDCDQIADILDKVANTQQNQTQDSAEALGQNPGLNAVLNDLLGLFGDIGTYGVLFKLAGFIKGRVEQMQDVEGNAKKVEKQAMYILKSFEKVEIRFTISNDVILEEAAQTFCHCAAVLQRIYQHDQSCQWSYGSRMLSCISRFCSAPIDQDQLLECIRMLTEFRENLLIALVAAPPATALPLVEGPKVGIDTQVEEILQFFQKSQEGVTCVVSICGLKGVGKSRLMFEVMNMFPKSPIENFFTMDYLGTPDLQHLQQELIKHLAGSTGETSSMQVGKNLIRKYLEFLKRKNRRVLLAFDNVDKAETMTAILPLALTEVLPPGSCILISLANNTGPNSAALLGVNDVFPRAARLVHVVPPLSVQDARTLFAAYAREERPSDLDLFDDLVDRCDGLPLLLQLVASVGFKRAVSWEDWHQVRVELTNVDRDIGQVKVAVENLQSTEDLSQASIDKLMQRLSSKVRVVYGRLDEQLQEAVSDIGNLLSGWDWQTVECILGSDTLKTLERKSLVSPKPSNTKGLTRVANLTRFSGPGPWKTKLVAMDGLLDASAVNQDCYLRAIPAELGLKNVKSICLVDSTEPVTGVILDKAKSLRYLLLHNTSLKGSPVNPLRGLQFLYWGLDKGSEGKFPFSEGSLPQLNMLMIHGQDVDLRGFKVPASVVHLTLAGCDISEQASETIIMSRTLEVLRLRDFKDVVSFFSSGRRSHLKRLCLEKCGSAKLTRAIGGLFQLTEIEILSCQNLTLLETGSIGTLHNLRRLSIIDCPKLNKLPDDLKNLSELTFLSLAFCSDLQGDLSVITRLRKLEELILTGCSQLRRLPSHLGDLSNLEKMHLVACTKLEHLPEDVGRLERLLELELDFCARLSSLPQNTVQLRCLQRLTLSSCSRLSALPEGLENLTDLEYLNILGCKSLAVPDQIIETFRNNNVVVHALQSDLRTSYRKHHPGNGFEQPFTSVPTDTASTEANAPFLSDGGPKAVGKAASAEQQNRFLSDSGPLLRRHI